MQRLNVEYHNRILGLLDPGVSQEEVARRFAVARTTIVCLVQRVRQAETVADRPRPGQRRVTVQPQDNYICQRHLKDHFETAAETASVIIGNRE